MRKYWQVYKVNVQNAITYRAPIIIYRLSNFLFLVVMASIWLAAKSSGLIGGYTVGELLTYYLVGMVIVPLVMWYPVGSIKEEINSGQLSVLVLPKPISYYWYKFFSEAGWHTISPIFAIINLFLALLLFGRFLTWSFDLYTLLSFTLAVVLFAILFFTLCYCLGLLSFWFTDTDGLSEMLWMGMFILGGQGIPLSFFPGLLKIVVNLTPFRYLVSFPLEIFTHTLTTADTLLGFAFQVTWILIFVIKAKLLWHRGLKGYSAFGN